MDYHFVQTKIPEPRPKVALLPLFKKFLPVFAAAIILPALMFGILNPVNTSLEADAGDRELTLWFEPHYVKSAQGVPIKVDIYSSFESGDNLLSPFKYTLLVTEGDARISQPKQEHIKPFRGKVLLGSVNVTLGNSPTAVISFDQQSFEFMGQIRPVKILTSDLTIKSR